MIQQMDTASQDMSAPASQDISVPASQDMSVPASEDMSVPTFCPLELPPRETKVDHFVMISYMNLRKFYCISLLLLLLF